MLEALANQMNDCVKVIAEVKRRSPSKGWLNENLDVAALARDYAVGGASAISVLTDTEHFAGAVDDLTTVTSSVSLPVLRKDFTVSENDVLDTAEMGASGVLLIAAILDGDELARYLALAQHIGLSALVEVHDADEIALAEFNASKAARTKATNAVGKRFIAAQLSPADATTALEGMGWPAGAVEKWLAAWTEERNAQLTTLTVAQIAAALKAGALLASQATPLLQDLGEDAQAIAAIIATSGANPAT